ncbi:hypothetical protein IW262DRAFT_1456908 [Armillaria fumosa]|nr:hypothetical protein IW262DRAFT_1456908 [Armillaria fumosa]
MNCKKQQAKQHDSNKPYSYQAWENTKCKHQTQPKEIRTVYATQKAPVVSSGYVGKHFDDGGKRPVALQDLVGPNSRYGFDYKPWGGRESIPVTDDEGHVIAVLAGQPEDPNWESIHTSASDLLDQS